MNRTDLLNHLIQKHGLKRYLEIGVQVPEINFDRIQCEYKVGVDPDPKAHATFCMTSDEFFSPNDPIHRADVTTVTDMFIKEMEIDKRFDLIFIDGLHTAEQVKKDFENSLKFLSPNGFIVLHDCNPEKEEHTIVPRPTPTGHWNGSCYKFAVQLASNWVNYKTVDIDNGCGIFYNCFPSYSLQSEPKNWQYFDKNRKELLNLISWDEFIASNPHI